ncbi:MAG: AAA family ATPase [Desulfamplus sp.]|nr:AAA family ATPase [Desulfamplus sp.]MBF0389631.1 AAA family ATPase [Desulfamplus sp.]
MRFGYGVSDFSKIINKGYFYQDRTDRIPMLEQAESQLFIRPRRFGKSLLLSTLEHYYDVAKKDEFKQLFGHLAIGKNPTSLRNSYFILKLDFSCVDPTGSVDQIRQSLFNHINVCIEGFCTYYKFKDFELPAIQINSNDALYSLQSLAKAVKATLHPLYLLIDEYDNFANIVMMEVYRVKQKYEKDGDRYFSLVHDQGALRTFFKTVKALTTSTMFDRVFITGVSPVVMSDITSGYNVAKNIYFEPEFNELCGFTQHEVENVVTQIVESCDFKDKKSKINEAVDLMKDYYNGYRFSHTTNDYVYNPTLCLFFWEQFQKSCQYPREMLDDNLAVDESKLEYIAMIPKGREILLSLMEKDCTVVIPAISKRFGLGEMMSDLSKDNSFLVSFLYYFGVLTIFKDTDDLQSILKVPNLVMKGLYVDRICKMFLPIPDDRDNGKEAARQVWSKGDIAPLCRFVEEKYFKVFANRDYRWANELTVKTAFLTLLYNDIIYIMDSEPAIDRRYADLTMIIRPDKRYGKVFDVLIEFKFVALKDVNIRGEDAKALREYELYKMPQIVEQIQDGERQIAKYGKELEDKYGNLRLQKFVVVSLGFERVCFKKVVDK